MCVLWFEGGGKKAQNSQNAKTKSEPLNALDDAVDVSVQKSRKPNFIQAFFILPLLVPAQTRGLSTDTH